MTQIVHILGLTLCTIQCVLHVSGNIRPPREVNTPTPVDCKLSSWGPWSQCDPCTKQRFRSRSIVAFGQFGGTRCLSSLGEVQHCVSDKDCVRERIDCGNDYECESGRCIKQRFLCNGDNDCGDYSDETCEDQEPKPVCRNMDIEVSEIGRTTGDGVNILGMETKRNPFDNEYFNGVCERVRDGNTRTYYRKPWNTAALVYQTKADKSFTSESFNDSVSLMTRIISEKTQNFEASLSLKVTPTEQKQDLLNISVGISRNRNESLYQLKEFSKQENKVFLRISGKVQLATFQMRTRNPVLSFSFIDDINNLPSSYEKAEYFSLLEMYGTHYTVSGSVGGKYDLVYVLDSTVLKSNDVTTKEVQDCLGFKADVNLAVPGVKLNLNVNSSDCSKLLSHSEANSHQNPVIHKVISFVEGGTVQYAAKLDEKLNQNKQIDLDDFVEWSASLVDGPVLIKQKPSPIYTLIPVTLQDAYVKSRNLERAIEDYIDEYSVCKCKPCENGGTVIVVDGECLCQCPDHFEGLACQKPKHALYKNENKAIDGRWGCWTDSSPCSDGEKTLKRHCNNPAPQFGGKPCGGDSERRIPC